MSERDLGSGLRSLGNDIEPRRVDLTGPVLDELANPRARRSMVVAAASLLVFVALIGLATPVREAVASLLGIGNTRVAVVEQLPEVSPDTPPPGSGPAGQVAPFALDEDLAGPILAFEERQIEGAAETIVRYEGLALSASPLTGWFVALKSVDRPEGVNSSITTDGEPVLWIEGPHTRTIGDFTEFVAGNVLVWVRDGMEFRLSGDLTLEEAITLAESLR